MSGRFVLKWNHAPSDYPFLKTLRRFSAEKRKTVALVDWEADAGNATQFISAEVAMSEWERLGYAKAEYVKVIKL